MLRRLKPWLTLAVLLGTMAYAIAEDITLTTYYPSPRGVYQELRAMGNLGVGIMAPASRLHVYSTTPADGVAIDGTTNPGLTLRNAGTVAGSLGLATAAAGWTPNAAANDLVIRTDNAVSGNLLFATQAGALEAMRITRAGNVGIGTATPTANEATSRLTVSASDAVGVLGRVENTGAGNAGLIVARTGATPSRWNLYTPAGSTDFRVLSGGVDVVTVQAGGNVGIGANDPAAPLDLLGGGVGPNLPQLAVGSLADTQGMVSIRGGTVEGGQLVLNNVADTGLGERANSWTLDNGPGNNFRLFWNTGGAAVIGVAATPAGRVGIGTAAPGARLDVNGTLKVSKDDTDCNAANAGLFRYDADNDRFEGCTVNNGWVVLGTYNP